VASARQRLPEEHGPPLIEAACMACLETRTASAGQSWWCDSHVHAAELAHVVSCQRELPMTTRHDSEIIPTGMRFC
jgi:hypothetical protein